MRTSSSASTLDVIIVGGGIVGVSTAMQLASSQPGMSILLLEKESMLAQHQSGHNSGVIHAGVYYSPGSLKAQFCKAGSAATYKFSREHGLRVEQCGKLIVATDPLEEDRLDALFERSKLNGLEPEMIDAAHLREIEPHISGTRAVRVKSSGIADYPAMTRKMAELAVANGVEIKMREEVVGITEEADLVEIRTKTGVYKARHAIVCGGLMADRLAKMCDVDLNFRIIPFRGEYYRLPAAKNAIVNHLIYPVPNPALPFLGVHLTRMIDGSVTVGPNAVLALAREGYRWRDVNFRDISETVLFKGFWKVLARNASASFSELKGSLFRTSYLRLCQRYCPELTLDDLHPYPAGVRAQAVSNNGDMLHDFVIKSSRRCLHVCNAPSPAATSAIPIGAHLVDCFVREFAPSATQRLVGAVGIGV